MKRVMQKIKFLLFLFSLIPYLNHAASERTIVQSDEMATASYTIVFGDLPPMPCDTKCSMERTTNESMLIPYDLPIDPEDIPFEPIESEEEQDTIKVTRACFASPATTINFQGLDDSFTVIPPDTQGAVGIDHVVTMLNDRVRVQTKNGTTLQTITLRSFWGLPFNSTPFDPKITYDPVNNRWIALSVANSRSSSSIILIATSQTSNPLGVWNVRQVKADATATPTSGVWADYPSLGFNGKWAVVQVNMFNIANNAFNRSHIYVFNKAALYTNSTASIKLFSLTGFGAVQAPAITYDASNPTLYLL